MPGADTITPGTIDTGTKGLTMYFRGKVTGA
jgi:hypothetical protein